MKLPKMQSRKIRVTQEIIGKAEPNNARSCVVAQAVREQIPDASSVRVSAESVSFNVRDVRYTYRTPGRVSERVVDFDDGKEVKPFAFTLRATQCSVAAVVRKGPMKKSKHKKRGKKTGSRVCSVRRYHGLVVVSKGE